MYLLPCQMTPLVWLLHWLLEIEGSGNVHYSTDRRGMYLRFCSCTQPCAVNYQCFAWKVWLWWFLVTPDFDGEKMSQQSTQRSENGLNDLSIVLFVSLCQLIFFSLVCLNDFTSLEAIKYCCVSTEKCLTPKPLTERVCSYRQSRQN